MKRRVIAAIWIGGATIPLLFATIYVAGCCVLPFHGVMHKLMPVCRMAVEAFRIDESATHRSDQPATPAEGKTQSTKVSWAATRHSQRVMAFVTAQAILSPVAATAYRSFITLGAIRCDRDVGLHLLVDTFRI
jgi:hypothetical protein